MDKNNNSSITLYSSQISDCSARLRIALNLKQLSFRIISVDLRTSSDNHDSDYLTINPAGTLPTLIIQPPNDCHDKKKPVVITQSIAALEYLDEAFPETHQILPPLNQQEARAQVRALVGIVATDIHPLTTHRVGRKLSRLFQSSESLATIRTEWDVHWITEGILVYEKMVQETAGKYSFGDDVTMADVCLLPELWTAERMGIGLEGYPTVLRIYRALSDLPCVRRARQEPLSELEAQT